MTPADLRAARVRLGMSQAQLAVALRMGKHGGRTVRGWEIGERDIPGPAQVAVELMLEKRRGTDELSSTAHADAKMAPRF